MPGEIIRLVGPDGVIEVPIEQAASALDRGYHVETDTLKADRLAGEAREATYGGLADKAATFAANATNTLTLGASNALISQLGGAEDLRALNETNENSALAGTIAGALIPIVPGVGASSLIRAAPGARAARFGAEVAGLGEGAGLLGRAAYNAGGAAIEGGLQSAGAYISDVALGDRELSAEGFTGAMGQGALWGGVAGGALTLAGGGLTAARKLFPRAEMTAANAAKVEREAVEQISRAVDDGDLLEQSARSRLSEIRAAKATDPDISAQLEAIKASKARELAARAEVAGAKADIAEETAWATKKKAADVRDGVRKPRKAMAEEPAVKTEAPGVGSSTRGATPEASAVAKETTGDAASLLERQLLGTKSALDAGESLAQIGARPKPVIGLGKTEIEDAINAHIATIDPEAAKLVAGLTELRESRGVMGEWLDKYGGGQVGKFERSQAARDYAEGMRPKQSGFYQSTPTQNVGGVVESEGNILGRRGVQYNFRGTDAERIAAEAKITAKVDPLEREAADAAVNARASRRMADEIVGDAGRPSVTIDDQVATAVKGNGVDINDDIAGVAPKISRYEAANAELSETLGQRAPAASSERATALRDAQRASEQATHRATADAASDIERATANVSLRPEVMQPPGAAPAGMLGKAQDAAGAYEILRMMGVPLPDPKDIPVVGPLLSVYLKARTAMKLAGKGGWKTAATAESTIASKAAQTKQRIYTAVDRMLEVGSKTAERVAPKVGGTTAILGHVLFADREREPEGRRAYSSSPKVDGIEALYQKRSEELIASQRPGAIRDSVRDKVRASDPTIVDAIVAAKERKLGYLNQHLPRPPGPPGLLSGSLMVWTPSKADLNSFARRVEAAEDPAGVLERAAAGESVSIEAADTLKAVYPLMFQEAQMRLVTKAVKDKLALPYSRRLMLSVLFDLPLDPSMDPSYGAFLQEAYKPKPPAPAPMPNAGAPTISADVNNAARVDPSA